MTRVWLAVAVVIAAGAAPAPVAAQQQLPAQPQTASLDSEAPPGAPPHWLPGERWVMQHWLPYDEERLHRLLGADRGDVWRWLRDDTRNLAGLAERNGKDPAAVAAALVEPWRGRLRDPARLDVLRERALRTLTQGHLAQHVFFHSLHQDAIPDGAPAIFGVRSREEFQGLRRAEVSPVQICRLNGLGRAHAMRAATAALRAQARSAVRRQAMPASQARRLLGRQLRQLPRWLGQRRYNGPPPLKLPRPSEATASNYSTTPALAAGGARIAFESYEAGLAKAKSRGEIAVMTGRADATAAPEEASRPSGLQPPAPRSAYNPAISSTGRYVAFEAAAGNLNFAKRYGQMQVFLRDTRRGSTTLVSRPEADLGRPVPRSAYDPAISGDGRRVAYSSSEAGRGRLDLYVRDLRRPAAERVPPPPGAQGLEEPALSGDGRVLAFSALAGERSAVYVRNLATGRTRRVSRPGDEAYEPSVSRDGRTVAYTVMAARGRGSHVEAWEAAAGRRRTVAPLPAQGLAAGAAASEPSLAARGRRVAFTLRLGGGRSAQVYVADLRTGEAILASRRPGRLGPPATGRSLHPSLSADGRTVAFASDAPDLARAKCNGARGVFVRDLGRGTTRLVSRGDGENRYAGPTRGSSTGADAVLSLTCL